MHLKFSAAAPVLTLLLSATLTFSACGGNAAETPPLEEVPETAAAADAATSPEVEAPAEAPESPTAIATEAEGSASEDQAAAEDEEEVASENEEASVTEPLAPAECEAIEIPNDERIPSVSNDDWAKGPESASLTLIEYGDFQ
jgi:hypothetical protein